MQGGEPVVEQHGHEARQGRLQVVAYTAGWAVVLATLLHPTLAQQVRSNLAPRTRTKHRTPALLLWCNALLREGSWWTPWWGSLDGMQGVRGSNPLSSTRHNASSPSALSAICQRFARKRGPRPLEHSR